jgi:hypothetical protein
LLLRLFICYCNCLYHFVSEDPEKEEEWGWRLCVCVCWGGRHQVVVGGWVGERLLWRGFGYLLGFDPFLSFVPSLLFQGFEARCCCLLGRGGRRWGE